ncbi:MAG: hypothetical protein CM1200mP26_10400 [Acidimicrobiales bacterium]|nr:MAG: hypothetical protein CM1200mP26_10400 [Acidimicrobiales bacterium]
MGAYSPVPFGYRDVVDHLMDGAVRPTFGAFEPGGLIPGVLYCGLMFTPLVPGVGVQRPLR